MAPPTVPRTPRELMTQMTNCYATLILITVISSDGRRERSVASSISFMRSTETR
jgi:hypothetical protein